MNARRLTGLFSLLVMMVAICGSAVAEERQSTLAMSLDIQVVAVDPDRTGRALATYVDENGGYYTYRSFDSVVLRLPIDDVSDVRDQIEAIGDTIVRYNPSTIDVTEELASVEAAIVSRREALDRVLEYVADATVSATLEFERELRSLNEEIEYYTGRRRALINSAQFATIYVALTTRESTIPTQLPSSFEWINTIDLYRFVDDIQYLEATR